MVQMELAFLQPAFKETERSYSESKNPAHESQQEHLLIFLS